MDIALDKKYTFKDYLAWADDVRRELIGGFVKLFPAPNVTHARVNGNLFWELRSLDGKSLDENDKLLVFSAPADVVFIKNDNIELNTDTVVQPDIFICKLSQIKEGRCYGVPLFIAEVLSKSNRKNDLVTKMRLYEERGVGEYWIVNPETKTIEVFCHNGIEFEDSKEYTVKDKIEIKVIKFEVSVNDIFKLSLNNE